jgi:hypothetical protein
MKVETTESKIREGASRQKERLALWQKVKVAYESGGVPKVEELLGDMADTLDQKRGKIVTKLAKEVGINDGNNQES